MHSGGKLRSAFGYQLDIPVTAVKGVKVENGSSAAGLEKNQDKAVVILFDDIEQAVARGPVTVEIELDGRLSMDKVTRKSLYNPFICVGDKGFVPGAVRKEIHLTNYAPTSLADPYPFGRNDDKSSLDKAGNPIGPYYYATSELYPFAIDLPVTDFRIPDEMVKIDVFYPDFADWVKSRGEKHKEWYKKSVKYNRYCRFGRSPCIAGALFVSGLSERYVKLLFYLCRKLENRMAKILIIDDEEQLRKLLARIIGLEGYEVAEAADCAEGLRMLRRCEPDVVLCDVKLPDGNGVEMVGRIKQAMPSAEVILLTAYGNIPDGVQAIKNGAFDYITKGDDNNKILPLLSRATEKAQMQRRLARLEDKLSEEHSFDRIIGSSEALRSAVALARKVAVTDTSVLLTGETGTGKEVFAQAIHHASPRAKGAFVAVNCSSFSKELLESELFGHRAGSFTGATKDKKGLFEEADKGTLFLDEIGEMPVELQAKLLRVLECGEFIKIGETRPTKVDLRIIAATNRDLEKEIASGNFREDLFFRLSVFRIHLPSLRERPGDIAEYARFFAAQFADRMGRRIDTIDKGYIAALERHAWHGNVRELRNVVERSLIMAEGNALTVGCLSPEFHAASCDGSVPDSMALDALERHHILRVLEYTKGNKAEAARLLGIGIATLYRKLESYGMKP